MNIATLTTMMAAMLVLTGCAGNAKTPAQAGFEGDYAGYQQREGSEEAYNRLFPGADLLKYDKVSFSKPTLQHANERAFSDVELQQLQSISERLHQKLTDAFADMLAPPGPGVLVVTPLIIEGELKANPKNVLDFIPFRIVINAGTRVYREVQGQELVEYSLAIALLGFDGDSGERVLGMIDRKTTDEIVIDKGNLQGRDLDQELDTWVERMRRNWANARTKTRTKTRAQ